MPPESTPNQPPVPPAPETPTPPVAPETPAQPSLNPSQTVTSPPLAPYPVNATMPPAPKKGRKLGLIGAILAIIIVLLAGTAGAYYGVVVPNKPENVLKSAMENLLEQRQQSSKGTLSVDFTGSTADTNALGGLKNVTVNFTSAIDTDKQAFDTQLDASASGIKLPVELRIIDQNLYFKVGDLSTLKSVASLGGPDVSQLIDALSQKLSNQWVEVDNSLLKQANADCVTSLFSGLTKQDVDQIGKAYSESPFLKVNSKAAETVDGVATTRYDLAIDEQKADAFGNKAANVPGLKKANDCSNKASQSTGDTQVKPTNSQAKDESFKVWVDKSKKIRKLELKGTDQDITVDFVINFTDDKVDITKPDGAKPLMQVLGDIGQLFGAGSPTGTLGASTTVNGVSPTCLQAIHDYAISGGTKPIPAGCL